MIGTTIGHYPTTKQRDAKKRCKIESYVAVGGGVQ